jgi:hypothetical protein
MVTNKNKSAYVTIRTPPFIEEIKINYGFSVRINRQPLSVAAPKKMVTQRKTFYKFFFMYTLQELAFLEFFSYSQKNYSFIQHIQRFFLLKCLKD